MKHSKKTRQGLILMVVLLILCVLGILAVSFTLLSAQDYKVAKREEWNIRAFYLARSGLEYYDINQMDMDPGTTKRIIIESGGERHYCDIEVRDEEVLSTGIIARSPSEPLCKITLKAPYGDVTRWYEVAQ